VKPRPSRLRKPTRFYVGGLPHGVSEGSLRGAFEHVGIRAGFIEIVLNASTGVSRGFAFVDFPGATENAGVSSFLAQLGAAQLGGRGLTIREVPELDDRFESRAGMAHPAPDREAIDTWDDEGGRNGP
jgi:RNA recognition motif